MRKGQEKLLKRVENDFSEEQLNILRREDLSLKKLDIIKKYFYSNKDKDSKELTKEVLRCLKLKPKNMSDTEFDYRLEFYILPRNDKLFKSNRKKWILKFNGKDAEQTRCYMRLVSQNYNPWCILFIVKNDIYKCDYPYSFYNLPTDIMENFLKEKEKSLFYYLTSEAKSKKELENVIYKLYNIKGYIKNAKFLLNPMEFKKYIIKHTDNNDFQIDCKAIEERIFNDNAFVQKIKKIFEIKENKHVICEFENKFAINEIKKIVSKTKIPIEAKIKNMFLEIIFSFYGTVVCYKEFNKIRINESVCGQNKYFDICLKITPDLRVYLKNRKGRYYPASVSQLLELGEKNQYLKTIIDVLFEIAIEKNLLYKDVYSDAKFGMLMPVKFNEINKYHTKEELITSKYKKSKELHIKWNKMNMSLAYMIIKSLPYVDEKGEQILLQKRKWSENGFENVKKLKEKIETFLTECILENVKIDKKQFEIVDTGILDDEEKEILFQTALDYVRISIHKKQKIKINIHSPEELHNKHNSANEIDYEKETGKVHIPKNSKFIKLREILPEEFE